MERFLLEFVLRTGLIALAAGLALRVFRIKAAAAQHAVWVGVVAAMLVLPIWMAWGPKAPLRVLPAPVESAVPASAASAAPASIEVAPIPVEMSAPSAARRSTFTWRDTGIGLYFLGAGALLLRLAVGTIRASRLTSASCVAPVTVGVIRPRVILPDCGRDWPQEQLDAVLTHEQAHMRRRDPMFQWLALFNRAVFWFHPLAWWLERRLSALAEEACDAAVLERGHDPQEYCEYLIELAHAVRRAGTRVNVVAMAMPGSYLPARVKKMMDGVRAPRVSAMRMTFAALACVIPAAVFAAGTLDHVRQVLPLPPLPAWPLPQAPVLLAQAPVAAPAAPPAATPLSAPAPKPEFEVASVKPMQAGARGGWGGGPGTNDPEHYSYAGALLMLLRIAYGVDVDQISGPDWLSSEDYTVSAKIPAGATKEQMNAMLQSLLEQRFHLTMHRAQQEFSTYELVIAKGGSKLKETAYPELGPEQRVPLDLAAMRSSQPDKDGFPQLPPGMRSLGAVRDGVVRYTFRATTITELGTHVSGQFATEAGKNRFGGRMFALGRVVDHTGLTGKYDFTLAYTSSGGMGGALAPSPAGQDPTGIPDLSEALEQQLGLKLQKTNTVLDVIVIDHIDRTPVDN
jgi:uncharacterized protein (TIGR03435 family)